MTTPATRQTTFPRRKPAALVGAVAVAASAVTLVMAAQPAAAAQERNGKCETGEFCYFYNSDQKGSVSDHKSSVPNLGDKQPSCYEFKGEGNGKGRCMKNNAASV